MKPHPMLCIHFYMDFKGDYIYVASSTQHYHFRRSRPSINGHMYDANGNYRARRRIEVHTYEKNIDRFRDVQESYYYDGKSKEMKIATPGRLDLATIQFSGMSEFVANGPLILDEVFWMCFQETKQDMFLVQEVAVNLLKGSNEISPFLMVKRVLYSAQHGFTKAKPGNFLNDLMEARINPSSIIPVYDNDSFVGFLFFKRQESELDFDCLFFGCSGKRLSSGNSIRTFCESPERSYKSKNSILHLAHISFESCIGVIK